MLNVPIASHCSKEIKRSHCWRTWWGRIRRHPTFHPNKSYSTTDFQGPGALLKTLGILANRFRVFRRPIIANIETVDLIVQATLVLHNWLRTEDVEGKQATYVPPGFADSENEDGTVREGLWRQEPEPTGEIFIVFNDPVTSLPFEHVATF